MRNTLIMHGRGLYFCGTVRGLLDALVRMPDRKVVDLLR